MEIFQQIKHFPDPAPGDDGHYLPFAGTETEKHRPSKKRPPRKQRILPFHGKLHVRNADLMLECEECGMWRLIYAKHKLSLNQRKAIQDLLEGMSFSCGSPLQDLDLPSDLVDEVFIRDLYCTDPIEVLYYSATYDPICIYCAKDGGTRRDKIP